MSTMRQLSILGYFLRSVYFKTRAVPIPTTSPISKLPKNTNKKTPIASKTLMMFKLPEAAPARYPCAVWNNTIAIASFSMDSPKMTVYSFGSTLYTLNIAIMVTGSVADSVAPTEIASTKLMASPSSGILVHNHSITPRDTADINVPANAKVRIVPMFRKKFACLMSVVPCPAHVF